jgi:hypothetical protein
MNPNNPTQIVPPTQPGDSVPPSPQTPVSSPGVPQIQPGIVVSPSTQPQATPSPSQPVIGEAPQIQQPTVAQPQIVAPSQPVISQQPAFSPGVAPQQPAAGYPQAQVFQSPTVPGQAMAQNPGAKSNKKLYIILGGIVTLIVIAAIALLLVVLSHPITQKQITAAENAATAFGTDTDSAATDLTNAQNDSTTTDLTKDLGTTNDKLTDAQNQFTLLKTSNTLHNPGVKTAFNTLSSEWTSGYSFLRGVSTDTQNLFPIVINLGNYFNNLSNTIGGTPLSASVLSGMNQQLQSYASQLNAVHVIEPQDKYLVSGVESFLQGCTQSISQAASDANAGAGQSTVQNDLQGLITAANNLTTTGNNYNNQVNAKLSQYDTASDTSKLQDALTNLSTTTKN